MGGIPGFNKASNWGGLPFIGSIVDALETSGLSDQFEDQFGSQFQGLLEGTTGEGTIREAGIQGKPTTSWLPIVIIGGGLLLLLGVKR